MPVVDVEVDEFVTTITLNRPERLNTMSEELLRQLAVAFIEFRDGPSRVAVLTAVGRGFCVGMDIKERAGDDTKGLGIPDIQPLINPYWDVTVGVPVERSLNKVVIAAVNGMAYGGGFYLATHADLIVAAESASFEVSEVHLGYLAGWEMAAAHNLQRGLAMELALGERITARRAYEGGLVNRVVADDVLMEEATKWAHAIASRPPQAVAYGRQLVAELMPTVPAAARVRANEWRRALASSNDAAEAMAGFMEKRPPRFTGS